MPPIHSPAWRCEVAEDSTAQKDEAALDVRVDSAAREGLTGTAAQEVYAPTRDPDDVTIAPDGRPGDEQPRWRRDFPIDWPEDSYVARGDFVKFLVLTSLAFVAGQTWIAAKSLVRRRQEAEGPAPRRIASLAELAPGTATTFAYPGEEPCLLVRSSEGELVAFSQSCTHLSCALVPEVDKGVLRCPCHEGYFELATGRNIAGPPPRPLPRITLELRGDEVWAVGVQTRTV
jgi:Rieske Fe-S protein